MQITDFITTEEELRQHYDKPLEGAVIKEKNSLNDLAKEFIGNSPFLCIASSNPDGSGDCSPKGDPAGFVKVLDDRTIAIPDRKGNNRLDTLVNILNEPKVGLIFFIPGKYETLRVNGRAKLTRDESLLNDLAHKGKNPTVAITVEIDEVYFHCPKALIRSKLWNSELDAKDLHSYAKISGDIWGKDLNNDEIKKTAQDYKDALKDRLY